MSSVNLTKQEAVALVLCAAEGLRGDEAPDDVKAAAVAAIEKLNVAFDLRIHEARS